MCFGYYKALSANSSHNTLNQAQDPTGEYVQLKNEMNINMNEQRNNPSQNQVANMGKI
jgi:hypothetical protein